MWTAEGKRPLGRLSCRSKNNIKFYEEEWTGLGQFQTLVNVVSEVQLTFYNNR